MTSASVTSIAKSSSQTSLPSPASRPCPSLSTAATIPPRRSPASPTTGTDQANTFPVSPPHTASPPLTTTGQKAEEGSGITVEEAREIMDRVFKKHFGKPFI